VNRDRRGAATRSIPEDVSPDLRWLIEALWADARVAMNVPTTKDAETYAVVPSARRPRFLLPASSSGAALGSLRSYNNLRPPRVRAARSAVALALRTPARRFVSRDRVIVTWPDPANSPVSLLRDILGVRDLAFAIGLAPRGPNRKPVLQAFSSTGRPLAFVKVGWNEITRARVRNESEALRLWKDAKSPLRVPRLLHEDSLGSLHLSVSAPLPPEVTRYETRSGVPLEALRSVWGHEAGRRGEIARDPYVRSLRERSLALSDAGRRRLLVGIIDAVADRDGSREVNFAPSHGDWVPWNLAREGDFVHAFDWEHWSAERPLGFDVVHWHFQSAFIAGEKPLAAAWTAATAGAAQDLKRMGLGDRLASAVASLYLVEMTLRAAESIQVGGAPNPRWEESINAVLAVARSDAS
jgi:hypothetical protein